VAISSNKSIKNMGRSIKLVNNMKAKGKIKRVISLRNWLDPNPKLINRNKLIKNLNLVISGLANVKVKEDLAKCTWQFIRKLG
jgi:hypothetical protein